MVILVVDDDALMLRALVRVLSRAGHEVVTATDGPSAMSVLAQRTDVGVVVSDYDMPLMTGLQLHALVKAEHPALPFVLHTANMVAERQAAELGVRAVLKSTMREVLDVLEEIAPLAP